MNTWRIGCISILVASILPTPASAAILINEFLYDVTGTDKDQEYVEILNTGTTEVDLTKYKINDGSSHALNAPPKNGGTGSIVIPAGGYALLVGNATNFIAAHPSVSGTIIDTVLSLTNTAATIALVDEGGAMVDSVTYSKDQGGNGDGTSLQRTGPRWVAALPTPLSANATEAAPPRTPTTSTKTTTKTTQSSEAQERAPAVEAIADAGGETVEESEPAQRSTSTQFAAAGSVQTGAYLWWLGAFGIALAACGAAFAAKHLQKKEWNIIDESEGAV